MDRPNTRVVTREFSSGIEKEAIPLADVEGRIRARIDQHQDEFRINWQRGQRSKALSKIKTPGRDWQPALPGPVTNHRI